MAVNGYVWSNWIESNRCCCCCSNTSENHFHWTGHWVPWAESIQLKLKWAESIQLKLKWAESIQLKSIQLKSIQLKSIQLMGLDSAQIFELNRWLIDSAHFDFRRCCLKMNRARWGMWIFADFRFFSNPGCSRIMKNENCMQSHSTLNFTILFNIITSTSHVVCTTMRLVAVMLWSQIDI
jgi:hypothetical protein